MCGLPEHYDPTEERYWFRNVPENEVRSETRRLASEVLEFVVRDLDLFDLTPAITWVRPERWEVARREHFEAIGRMMEGQGEILPGNCVIVGSTEKPVPPGVGVQLEISKADVA